MPNNPLLARMEGFSLHVATVCEAYQRGRLERLCRYITRPPIATKRLSVDARGRVVYQYKQPFRDGSTHVVLEPLDFIARLAALVPRPRLNLTRFHSAGESSRTVRPQGVSEAAKPLRVCSPRTTNTGPGSCRGAGGAKRMPTSPWHP
jgi:hypothetical protein